MQHRTATDAGDVTPWFFIERGTNPNPLADRMARFPQSERQIRELDAFFKIDEALPDRELTPEGAGRAVAIGRGVVKAMLTGQRMGWSEAAERAAAWIESPLSGESNERAIKFDSNMTMSLRAAEKLACARPTLPFSGAVNGTQRNDVNRAARPPLQRVVRHRRAQSVTTFQIRKFRR